MSICDEFDFPELSLKAPVISAPKELPQFDFNAFSEMFPADAVSEYEFEPSSILDYIPPKNGLILPDLDADSDYIAVEPEAVQEDDLDYVMDSCIYRSNDGTSEFCSFDDVVPDITPDGWHRDENALLISVITEATQAKTAEEIPQSEAQTPDTEESEPELKEPEHENDAEGEDEDEDLPLKHPVLHALGNVLLGFVTFISILYLVCIYSDNVVITKARNMYIQTAMSTLNHKWLATAIVPPDIIKDLMRLNYESESLMVGVQSNWGDVDVQALPRFENATTELTGGASEDEPEATPENTAVIIESDSVLEELYGSIEEQTFFELFYEIDYNSMQDYVDAHPEVIANGWENININEAGLNDVGTDIKTVYGDQVLAVNAQEGVILIRVNVALSRGVLAIGKDTSKLRLCAASTLGSTGQTAGRICLNNNGILAITANGFDDPDGMGNGGVLSGLAVCSNVSYGYSIGGGYKRLEIRDNDHMYIVDSSAPLAEGTRDACEFTPALIIDGEIVVDENSGWTSPNPRSCIGQTAYLESMMVIIEGRFADSPGCSVIPVAELMQKYGCVQAMNMDGGTSAIMFYDGEYVTRCSNVNLPTGRTIPTAWVYGNND